MKIQWGQLLFGDRSRHTYRRWSIGEQRRQGTSTSCSIWQGNIFSRLARFSLGQAKLEISSWTKTLKIFLFVHPQFGKGISCCSCFLHHVMRSIKQTPTTDVHATLSFRSVFCFCLMPSVPSLHSISCSFPFPVHRSIHPSTSQTRSFPLRRQARSFPPAFLPFLPSFPSLPSLPLPLFTLSIGPGTGPGQSRDLEGFPPSRGLFIVCYKIDKSRVKDKTYI